DVGRGVRVTAPRLLILFLVFVLLVLFIFLFPVVAFARFLSGVCRRAFHDGIEHHANATREDPAKVVIQFDQVLVHFLPTLRLSGARAAEGRWGLRQDSLFRAGPTSPREVAARQQEMSRAPNSVWPLAAVITMMWVC